MTVVEKAVEKPSSTHRYYGKYRGSVVNNVDPSGLGRLLVNVPDVTGVSPSSWAMPCLPFTGPAMGTYIVPPPVGAGVWVEFEQGSVQKPIWVGCFWDVPEGAPGESGAMAQIAMRTPPGSPLMTMEMTSAGIALSEAPVTVSPSGPGQITLYAGASSITLSDAGITITAPVVSIVSPNFNVNKTHLVVV